MLVSRSFAPAIIKGTQTFDVLLSSVGAWYVNRAAHEIGSLIAEQKQISVWQWLGGPRISPAHAAAMRIELSRQQLPVIGLAEDSAPGPGTIKAKKIALSSTNIPLPKRDEVPLIRSGGALTCITDMPSDGSLFAMDVLFQYESLWIAANDKQEILKCGAAKSLLLRTASVRHGPYIYIVW